MATHSKFTGLELHEAYHFVQEADPGAVGSNLYWLQVSTGNLKRRSADNASWTNVAGTVLPITTKGDILIFGAAASDRLAVGSDTQVLTADSTQPKGLKWAANVVSLPVTTKGDLLVHDGTIPNRLAVGTDAFVLTADSTATKGIKWAAVAASAAPGTLLFLDYPPATAHAKDDDFLASTLDAKWTSPANSLAALAVTVASGNSWMRLTTSTAGTASTGKHGIFGIRQAAPTGSFTMTARISLIENSTVGASDTREGIWLGITGGKAYILGIMGATNNLPGACMSVNGFSLTADWGIWDSVAAPAAATGDFPLQRCGHWFRFIYNATASTLQPMWSADGLQWHLMTTYTSIAQPNYIGLGMWSNSGTVKADQGMGCDWFRITEP